jgi:glycine/D-amino acid oxidase-like deaminating enzyme
MVKEKVFWHETADMPSDDALKPLPEKADVAIIGGGYTGLSAARTLAKRGLTVAVLEANTIGWGASSRNGGMVLTGLKLSMQTVFQKYGRDTARELFQCSLDSIDTVEQIIQEEKIACGFTRAGHLVVANKPGHYRTLEAEAGFMDREFGHPVKLIPRTELHAEIGSQIYHGGLLDEVSGGLNPAQYVTGLARAAENAGVALCARARVHRLRRGTNGYALETERGQVGAENVLVATSGYTSGATPVLQRRIIPIGSFIIASEQLPEPLTRELIPHNRMIFDSKHYLHYFRLWKDRMIFGGRAAFFPENGSTVRHSAEILRREMIEAFPQLRNVQVEYAWGGTLDFAFDMMPHVGETDGLFYSLGYAGHGVAMATHLGKTVAEEMIAGGLNGHPFSRIKFPGAPLGLYDGRPWFLPLAGLWHKILDWVE